MSETPTPEPLKPDTEEEIVGLRQNLERANTIINLRNQEIAVLNSRLAGKDEIIAEADEQIERLESEIVATDKKISESEEQVSESWEEIAALDAEIENLKSELASKKNKSSATTGKDLSEIEAADILNQLKARRKKTKADSADIEAILEILDKQR